MKRIIKIIRTYWFMDPMGDNLLIPIAIICAILLFISACSDTTMGFSYIFYQIIYINIMYYVFVFNTQRVTKLKRKVDLNLNDFLIQAPVLKQDISNAKFIISQVVNIPLFIVVVYFIILNVFVNSSDTTSSYSGFLVLFYCIWTIALSISIGFSSLSSKKYKAFIYLPISILLLLSIVFMFYLSSFRYIQPGYLVNGQKMFSGLGPRFVPILKTCRYIGGVSGLIVILMSSLINYFFISKLPQKISEKVGI